MCVIYTSYGRFLRKKISEKSKKKISSFLTDFFEIFLLALFGPKSCKTTILTIFRLLGNLLSAQPPKAEPRGAEGAIRRVYQVSGLDDIFCGVSVHTPNDGHKWKNPGLQNSEKTFRDDCKLSSREAQV